MQLFRRSVLACALVGALALATSASASDREAGPRDPSHRSAVAKIIARIIQALDDLSFPPPH